MCGEERVFGARSGDAAVEYRCEAGAMKVQTETL